MNEYFQGHVIFVPRYYNALKNLVLVILFIYHLYKATFYFSFPEEIDMCTKCQLRKQHSSLKQHYL